jgi:phospholipase C
VAGDNGWQDNHAALNGGLNNDWATNNTPWSWGHFQRSDIPVQFAYAEGWTVGDMYQVSCFRLSLGRLVPSTYFIY